MYEVIVKVEGKNITETINLQWLHCNTRINHVPILKLRVTEGPAQTTKFPHTDEDTFKIGKKINIKAGLEKQKKTIFNGLITEHKLGISGMVYLEVIAYGDAIKLTEGPRNQLFAAKKTDTDIIKKLFKDTEIKAGEIATSTIKHGQYFAYQQTPWRTMMARVLSNGFLFVPQPDSNHIIDPSKQKPENTHKISLLAAGLQTFELHQDARSIIEKNDLTTWDIKKQELLKPVKGKATLNELTHTAKETLNLSELHQQEAAPLSPEEIQARANAQQIYRTLDRFQGTLSFDAEALTEYLKGKPVALFDVIDLQDFGKNYTGKYLVSGIQHHRKENGWQIILTLGIHLNHTLFSDWLQPPPVPNLIGKIAAFKEDPEKLERIPVWLPTITNDDKKVVWARLLSPFASQSEGLHVPPSKDDEVIVGFIGGDSRYPVILGATHNPVLKPPLPYDKDNAKRGLFFKDVGDKKGEKGPLAGLHFDNKKKIMRLQGGKQAGLNLDDKEGPNLHYTKDSKKSFDKGQALSHMIVGEKYITQLADKKQKQTLAKNMDIKVDGNVTVKTTMMEIK